MVIVFPVLEAVKVASCNLGCLVGYLVGINKVVAVQKKHVKDFGTLNQTYTEINLLEKLQKKRSKARVFQRL